MSSPPLSSKEDKAKGKGPEKSGLATHSSGTSIEVSSGKPKGLLDHKVAGPPIGVVKDQELFALAARIQEVLKGQSKRTCLKVLGIVGSIHGIRAIPVDRPIGQSSMGTVRPATAGPKLPKTKKGKTPPPAVWKQTEDYRLLSDQRSEIVKTIKSLPTGSGDIQNQVEVLRTIEQKLKALKAPQSGN